MATSPCLEVGFGSYKCDVQRRTLSHFSLSFLGLLSLTLALALAFSLDFASMTRCATGSDCACLVHLGSDDGELWMNIREDPHIILEIFLQF